MARNCTPAWRCLRVATFSHLPIRLPERRQEECAAVAALLEQQRQLLRAGRCSHARVILEGHALFGFPTVEEVVVQANGLSSAQCLGAPVEQPDAVVVVEATGIQNTAEKARAEFTVHDSLVAEDGEPIGKV